LSAQRTARQRLPDNHVSTSPRPKKLKKRSSRPPAPTATPAAPGGPKKQRVIAIPDTVIGRVERVDLPEWNVGGLKAKVDTGARTSSIHVEDLRVLTRNRVRFAVVLQDGERRWIEAPISRTGRVRSSNGHMETRYFVTTELRLGPITKDVEISLTGRADMTYRMLLGRLALEGDFIVDVSHRFIANRQTQRRGHDKATDAVAPSHPPRPRRQ
jgi:hypothetical protein